MPLAQPGHRLAGGSCVLGDTCGVRSLRALWRKRVEMKGKARLGDLEGRKEEVLGQPGGVIFWGGGLHFLSPTLSIPGHTQHLATGYQPLRAAR